MILATATMTVKIPIGQVSHSWSLTVFHLFTDSSNLAKGPHGLHIPAVTMKERHRRVRHTSMTSRFPLLSIALMPVPRLRSFCSRHSNRSFPISRPTTLRQVKGADPLRLIPDPGRCLRPRPRWLASRGSRLREPARPSLPSAQGKTIYCGPELRRRSFDHEGE